MTRLANPPGFDPDPSLEARSDDYDRDRRRREPDPLSQQRDRATIAQAAYALDRSSEDAEEERAMAAAVFEDGKQTWMVANTSRSLLSRELIMIMPISGDTRIREVAKSISTQRSSTDYWRGIDESKFSDPLASQQP